eukprot:Nitzschia sp. Nitz4//scaffold202_size38995//661//2607//NITZ4_007624-RA/size38995-processed-gene-0.69-mRNA-1//1//CDS//3329541360//417//frame0
MTQLINSARRSHHFRASIIQNQLQGLFDDVKGFDYNDDEEDSVPTTRKPRLSSHDSTSSDDFDLYIEEKESKSKERTVARQSSGELEKLLFSTNAAKGRVASRSVPDAKAPRIREQRSQHKSNKTRLETSEPKRHQSLKTDTAKKGSTIREDLPTGRRLSRTDDSRATNSKASSMSPRPGRVRSNPEASRRTVPPPPPMQSPDLPRTPNSVKPSPRGRRKASLGNDADLPTTPGVKSTTHRRTRSAGAEPSLHGVASELEESPPSPPGEEIRKSAAPGTPSQRSPSRRTSRPSRPGSNRSLGAETIATIPTLDDVDVNANSPPKEPTRRKRLSASSGTTRRSSRTKSTVDTSEAGGAPRDSSLKNGRDGTGKATSSEVEGRRYRSPSNRKSRSTAPPEDLKEKERSDTASSSKVETAAKNTRGRRSLQGRSSAPSSSGTPDVAGRRRSKSRSGIGGNTSSHMREAVDAMRREHSNRASRTIESRSNRASRMVDSHSNRASRTMDPHSNRGSKTIDSHSNRGSRTAELNSSRTSKPSRSASAQADESLPSPRNLRPRRRRISAPEAEIQEVIHGTDDRPALAAHRLRRENSPRQRSTHSHSSPSGGRSPSSRGTRSERNPESTKSRRGRRTNSVAAKEGGSTIAAELPF